MSIFAVLVIKSVPANPPDPAISISDMSASPFTSIVPDPAIFA
jgi:hypothetical protein